MPIKRDTINLLVKDRKMRIILFTGKGGVGKTTLAAATAYLSALKGHKTLIISADAAHSLSDSFEMKLFNTPRLIAPCLYGQEVNPQEEIEKKWGKIKKYLVAFFSSQGIDTIEAEEMSVFPGMEELFSLMAIHNYHRKNEYEVIIVDCAPTGDTLRFLSAPEITNWYLKHIFPLQRTAAKAVRPVANRVLPFPFPEDEVFETMKNLTTQLAEMREILADPEKTSIRLIINPEKMVIKEAQRAYTFFNLFGYVVDMIIVNRLIPADVQDVYFQKWKDIQKIYMRMIRECFSPLPIFTSDLFSQEIVGKELLEKMARKVYDKKDPTQLFFAQKPITVEKTDGGFDMFLYLPFVERQDIDLFQKGEELSVKIGLYKRNILLPQILQSYSVKGARFEKERLKISFRQ
ncbi:MAG: ArsA family ATPase [Candidatus Aminicenantales bacterium]